MAALAHLAQEAGPGPYELTLPASGRSFEGHALKRGGQLEAWFDPGPVRVRPATPRERDVALAALSDTACIRPEAITVAALGRPRLLVPIGTLSELARLCPNYARLRDGCDQLGLLGCYVHTPPTKAGQLAARMFAPSIGVPEDIANANSTACLAARLAQERTVRISVEMGDSLGSPATIIARADPAAGYTPPAPRVGLRVGGAAKVTDNRRL